MPMDLACAQRRPQARGFRDLCVPGHHEDSITEETETDQMEAETSQGQFRFHGYTSRGSHSVLKVFAIALDMALFFFFFFFFFSTKT